MAVPMGRLLTRSGDGLRFLGDWALLGGTVTL
jgi:hypothetical protein